jgi:photosystem II stability/assembly factor-like uncharacterized protein
MKDYLLFTFMPLIALVIGCERATETTVINAGKWELVRKAESTKYYHGIYFTNRLNGWVVGDSGWVLHTSNAGDSWETQSTGTTVSLQSVQFIGEQTGWVVGSNVIGMTKDGGRSWNWQYLPGDTRRGFLCLSFANQTVGWIGDNLGGILHTEDGGKTWTTQISGTTWAITSVQFLDPEEGWATAVHSIVLHTTDGGNNWTTKILDTLNCGNTGDFNDIFFISHSNGWIATNNAFSNIAYPVVSSIVHTSDAGKTWACQPMQTPETASLQFINESSGWAAGWDGIFYTSDGGVTWVNQLGDSSHLFVDLCFVDQSHGWAITFMGNIYRYQAL